MKLIFVRHGDPDYKTDSLTIKGKREAGLLSERVASWAVTDFFTSPLGRARETAAIALRLTDRHAEVLPWLQEFSYPIVDPETGSPRIAWDWLPSYFTAPENAALCDKDAWMRTPVMESGAIAEKYRAVCDGFDAVLARYGYVRDGAVYTTDGTHCQPFRLDKSTDTEKQSYDDRALVFFCHLGVMFAILSHMLSLSPVQLWQGFFVAPTSVTVLGTEERVPGTAVFRVELLGDTRHLAQGGEPVSASGFYSTVFNG